MWLVRTSSMLMLVTALLLPPGLYRNCCCTQRSVSQRTSPTPVRACCAARMKLARADASAVASGVGLKNRPCQCKSPVAPVAVIADKLHWSTIGSDGPIDGVLKAARPICRLELSDSVAGNSERNDHLIGPPVRKTLCRWMI